MEKIMQWRPTSGKRNATKSLFHLVLVLFLAILLLSQFGTVNPYASSTNRWITPVNEGEANELSAMSCVENFLMAIPKGSQINLESNAGPYWEQRFIEISFPRIAAVETRSAFTVHLASESNSNAQVQCGTLFLGMSTNE